MQLNTQKILILLIITLICSITPSSAAIQADNNTNWNVIWSNAFNSAFNLLNGDMDAELTPEQQNYLEAHQDLLENKSYHILNDTQSVLDYLIPEYNKYNGTSDNSKKRSAIGDTFKDSLNDVKNYLNGSKFPVNTTSYTYNELAKRCCNNTDNRTDNKTNFTSSIIIQINDEGYVRYLELDHIDNDTISLHSPKLVHNVSSTQFKGTNMHREKINIIIVNSSYNRTDVERKILAYQEKEIDIKIGVCAGCTAFCGVCSAVSTGLATNGLKELCLTCRREVMTKEVQLQIQGDIHPDFDGEVMRLIPETTTITQQIQERVCVNCKRPVALLVSGIVTSAALFTGSFLCLWLTLAYNSEKKNLGYY